MLNVNVNVAGCMEFAKRIPWHLLLEDLGYLSIVQVVTTQCYMIMIWKGMSLHLIKDFLVCGSNFKVQSIGASWVVVFSL